MKWFSLGLGVLLGVSHIGMIGMIARRQGNGFPNINIPVGNYTSYHAEVSKEGYKISYRSKDPKIMYKTSTIKEKAGFLGLANNTKDIAEQFTMEGDTHISGSVNKQDNPTASNKSEACIEAVGAAKGTGRLVGTSVGAAAAPTLSSIPFVGWVAAGWVAMFGGDQGANIGGNMAEDLNKNC